MLGKVEDIGFAYLTNKDVVRHPLVQKIVTAYDDYEKKIERRKRVNESKENEKRKK